MSLAILILLAGCSRQADTSLRFRLETPSLVSLNLLEETETKWHGLLEDEPLSIGEHRAEIRDGEFSLDGRALADAPAGKWRWRAYSHAEFKPLLLAQACQPGGISSSATRSWIAADGSPSAVACDEKSVYLGSSAGQGSGALVALDLEGSLRWNHQREGLGVFALGCDQGIIYVLADSKEAAGGSLLYKLDSKNGTPVPWSAAKEADLRIGSLWPSDAASQPAAADAMAVCNGRIYLSFTTPGFVAVLDAEDGHYVTTISGPQPRQMAVSTTPMRTEDSQETIADFGVAVLGPSALSYFVMPHDPPWIAFNTTHLLADDEKILAFTMSAETMKSGKVDLYVALGAPYFQVQRKQVEDLRGFSLSAGKPGGRARHPGPWEPEALRSIHHIALDAAGRLWIAESDARPGRFSVWTCKGSLAKLEREFFPPIRKENAGAALLYPENPDVLIAAGCEWKLDAKTGQAACMGVITEQEMQEASFMSYGGRHLLAARDASAVVTIYERSAPGDWHAVDWEHPIEPHHDNSNEETKLLAKAIPERDRSTLMRMKDGRAFFISKDGGFSVMEITGAKSFQKLGEGEWMVKAPQ